jgi:hypothetical protein
MFSFGQFCDISFPYSVKNMNYIYVYGEGKIQNLHVESQIELEYWVTNAVLEFFNVVW